MAECVQCRYCQAVAEDAQPFGRRRRSFRQTHYHICHACDVKRAERREWTTLLAYVGLGCAAAIWAYKDPSPGFRWTALNLTVIYLAFVPSTALHEIAHGLAALAVRWRVYQLLLGWFGKPLLQWKWRGVKWQINSVPVGGMAYVFPRDERWFSAKASAVYLAGPLANLIVAWGCFEVVGWPYATFDRELHLVGGFGLANLTIAVANLIPYRHRMGGVEVNSDGRAALLALFRPGRLLRDTMALSAVMEAQQLRAENRHEEALAKVEHALTRDPDNIPLQTTKGVSLLDLQQYRAAREHFLSMLQRKFDLPIYHAIALNNVAWADVMLDDRSLIDEALSYSERGLKGFEVISAIQGTRGSVLVWAGRYEEGIKWLEKAFESKRDDRQGAALNACMLAIGHAQLGNAESARWRKVAMELDSNCLLLSRVDRGEATRALSSAPTDNTRIS